MSGLSAFRRALGAATILALAAAVLLSGTPAQAQTTVWSATLTVDDNGNYFGCDNATFGQDNCSDETVLTNDDFVYKGTTYTIVDLTHNQNRVFIRFSGLNGAAAKSALGSLTLNLGSHSFAVNSADTTALNYMRWLKGSLSWTNGQRVSVRLTGPAPLPPPTGLKAVPGNGRVLLVWDNPHSRHRMGDWEYRVRHNFSRTWRPWQRFGPPLPEEDRRLRPNPAYAMVEEGLRNESRYFFQVRAVNSAGPGLPSAEVAAIPSAQFDPEVSRHLPTREYDPVVVTPGRDRLKVSWANAARQAWGYTVEWRRSVSEDYGVRERTIDVPGSVTETVITGLTPGTPYLVRVSYWDINNGVHRSFTLIPPRLERGDLRIPNYDNTEVRATTLGALAQLGQVPAMRATSGEHGIAVGWSPVLGADGYLMEWRATEQEYHASRRQTFAGEAQTAGTIVGVSPGKEYAVRVMATREGASQGAPSEEAFVRAAGVTASPGVNSLRVAWTPQRQFRRHPQAGYTLEWGPASEDYSEARRVAVRADTTGYEFPGLDGGVEYKVRVSWRPGAGGDTVPVGEVRGTPAGEAGVSPRLAAATVRGATVALGYDKVLDADPTPSKNAFRVTASDKPGDIVDVSVEGSEVRLQLARPIGAGDPVTVSYTPPARADGRVRSAAGAAAPGFSDRAVTNQTAAPLPALSVADAEAAEGAALSFAVTLSEAATGPVTVDWATADGTAVAGEDYTGATGALTFAAGETSKTVTVATLADTGEEETETLTLTLSDPDGAVLGDAEATGSITDVAPVLQRGPEPLTAAFTGAPSEHGGKGEAFTVRVAFGAPVTVGATRAVREGTVAVGNARVVGSTRVERRKDLWEFRIKPGSHGDVTLTLAAASDCAAPGAICTADGGKLASALALTVSGPAVLDVADARANEGVGATIDFAVTLSRAASGPVTVDYATRDKTAKAGEDYTAASGTLTFAAGETAKTVSVTVLDDAHDEGEERFTLRLSNATGARIGDGKAVGVIENSGPLQKDWLARFGRAAASDAIAAVTARLETPRDAGSHFTVGGQRLPLDGSGDGTALTGVLTGFAQMFGAPGAPAADDDDPFARHGLSGTWDDPMTSSPARRVTGRELLLGTSFRAVLGSGAGFQWTSWGQGASVSRFSSATPSLSLSGETATGSMGMDYERGRLLTGIAMTHSLGEGAAQGAGRSYALGSSVTTAIPYARLALSERLSVWGLAGTGSGRLTLDLDSGASERYGTDLSMTLAAVGMRGDLVTPAEAGGFALALKADAFWVRTESEAVSAPGAGNLAAARAEASRLRAVLDGSRTFALAGGATLTPSVEFGVRHDGGDAETGTGMELGAGVGYADPSRGLDMALRVHGLAAHAEGGYSDWSVSGSLRFVPGASGRGLSMSLTPSYGADPGGSERLWTMPDASGLAANGPNGGAAPSSRLDAEAGYGMALFGGGYTGTPNVGFGLSDTARELRMGWRLSPAGAAAGDFSFRIDASRRDSAGDTPEHRIGVGVTARW